MSEIDVKLFGEFQVSLDGTVVELPPSKKARALLAYLIITARPQRREHLCELFWDTPNDPKGSLRWALSKLRSAFPESLKHRVTADRERISIDLADVNIDLATIESLLESQLSAKAAFLAAKQTLNRPFLEGLELSNLEQFSAWLTAKRSEASQLEAQLIERCLKCGDLTVEEEAALSREWLDAQPYNPHAAKAFLKMLSRQSSSRDVEAVKQSLIARFQDAGIELSINPTSMGGISKTGNSDRKLLDRQRIQFCRTSDDVTLAYASVGAGPPLVKAANWLTHLELDWSAPIWSPLYRELAQDFRFIRYDERGNGLSDWDVEELSQETFVKDLECVVDTLGLETFPLLGISQGAAVSIEYAIRHPDRVSKLVLFGGYPKGWKIDATPEIIAEREAMITLTKTGWGQNNPAYRHVFSSTFMPDGSHEDLAWFNEFQRKTTSPDNAVKFLQAFADIDVRHQLSKITVPTLVIHSRGDQRIDWKVGRDIAAEIPNAEFVTLESNNHLLLEGEPAAEDFISAVKRFLLN